MSAPSPVASPSTTPPSPFTFDPIPDAIDAIARGEFVVVMDDESRENEGDLICAAGKITTEGMAWMVRWTRWVVLPTAATFHLHLPTVPSLCHLIPTAGRVLEAVQA